MICVIAGNKYVFLFIFNMLLEYQVNLAVRSVAAAAGCAPNAPGGWTATTANPASVSP
jgi:hypothetical protein